MSLAITILPNQVDHPSPLPMISISNKRKKKGDGCIEQVRSGKYRFRMKLPDGKIRWSQVYDTYEEAEEVRSATAYMLRKKQGAPTKVISFREWGEQWMARRNNRNRRTDRCNWDNHVATAFFADLPIDSLKRSQVKEWLYQLQSKPAMIQKGKSHVAADHPISQQTQTHAFNLLQKCLKDAVDEGFISTHPAHDLKVAKQSKATQGWTFLRSEEIQALLESEKVLEPARSIYQIAIYTGMRQGELWGLRWEDVDLESELPQIKVCRNFKGPTKSGKERIIPMLPPVKEALERLQATKAPEQTLVFPNPEGEYRCKGNDAGWADRKSKDGKTDGHKSKVGIKRPVRFHDLRHTCASHLAMGTWGEIWKLEEIRDYLGHSSITVTQRYAHLSQDHLHKKAANTGSKKSYSAQKNKKEKEEEEGEKGNEKKEATYDHNPTKSEPNIPVVETMEQEKIGPRSVHEEENMKSESNAFESISRGEIENGSAGIRTQDQRLKRPYRFSILSDTYLRSWAECGPKHFFHPSCISTSHRVAGFYPATGT